MIPIILKLSIRNILKHKKYFFLNLGGLTVGLICSILLFAFIFYEINYDSYNKNSNQIYRIASKVTLEGGVTEWARTPAPLAPALKEEYPEIKNYARIRVLPETTVNYLELTFNQENIYVSDSSLFNIFSFDFIYGNKSALAEPGTIVLTESLAKKIFGDSNPLDKILKVDENLELAVKGVIKDLPGNSHLKFAALVSWSSFNTDEQWDFLNCYTYLLFPSDYKIQNFERKLPAFIKDYIEEIANEYNAHYNFIIQPLSEIHLKSNLYQEISPNGNSVYIYVYLLIAIFFVIISSLNYTNMAILSSALRAKEIGIKKVVGFSEKKLRKQFIIESLAITFIALILAILIVLLVLPNFNQIIGQEIPLSILFNPMVVLGLLGLFVVVGLLSGMYPAFYISSFNPALILKGKINFKKTDLSIRKVLVILQFTISIVMIIATFIVVNQLNYILKKDLGLSIKDVVVIRIPNNFEALGKAALLKTDLLKSPLIERVAASSFIPTKTEKKDLYRLERNGKTQDKMYTELYCDKDFIELMGIKIIAGRNFSSNLGTDLNEAFIINEAAVKEFQWENPIGKRILGPLEANGIGEKEGMVVGVVKDFHITSLHQKVEPLIISLSHQPYLNKFLFVKIKEEGIKEAIEHMGNSYKKFYDSPFEYQFLEGIFDKVYNNDKRMNYIFMVGAFLMIFISCLGLYNLSGFTALRKTKEVGIRKVLGASVANIFKMHIMSFYKLAIIANLLAWPLAYMMMNIWLRDFAYKANINIFLYCFASLISLLIIFITISYHAIKSARLNPIKVLKVE